MVNVLEVLVLWVCLVSTTPDVPFLAFHRDQRLVTLHCEAVQLELTYC